MARERPRAVLVLLLGAAASLLAQSRAPIVDSSTFAALTWRSIGPYEAGQALDVEGVSSKPGTIYAGFDGAGLWRTEDYGLSWEPLLEHEPAYVIHRVAVDATNPDRLTVAANGPAGAAVYASSDAGSTWLRSDGQSASMPPPGTPADVPGASSWTVNDTWTDPQRPNVVVVATSTGVRVSLSSGRAWSQPAPLVTSGFSSVITDNSFPYRICGSQPARSAECVPSTTSTGAITPADWRTVGQGTPDRLAPDPANPRLLFLAEGPTVSRLDRETNVLQDVSPVGAWDQTTIDAPPLVVRSLTPRTLLYATDRLWQSANGGQTWTALGWPTPRRATDPDARMTIVTLSASPIDADLIWLAAADGGVHVSREGGTNWTDVTPDALPSAAHVTSIGPSHFDGNTAYVAFDRAATANTEAGLLRTRDSGRSWTSITNGLPPGTVHVVREDPLRRGFLWAGTDVGVFVSFDDGDGWQSLGSNMPVTSITDLVIHDADVIAATASRGVWVLDDMSPLRQITADVGRAPAFLFRPSVAYRSLALQPVLAPRLPEEPVSVGPDGVAITYLVGESPALPATAPEVALEVVESLTGEVIRRFAGNEAPSTPGLHRVHWDLRHMPPPAGRFKSGSGQPVTDLRGLVVVPGAYQVRLTVGDTTLRQAVVVRLDPRLRVPPSDLALQYSLSKSVDGAIRQVAAALDDLEAGTSADSPSTLGRSIEDLRQLGERLVPLFVALQQADARPTPAQERLVEEVLVDVERQLTDPIPGR